MRFRILGPLELLAGPGAEPVAPSATKLRVVLGTLLVRANQVVSAEDLIDELWPTAPPRTATTTLQVYISQLRKLLHSVDPVAGRGLLETRAPGYALRATARTLDALHFEELLTQGQYASVTGDFEAAAELCGQASGLWRGSLLADLPPGLLLERAARRLSELRATALDERVRAELRLGRHRDLVAELQSLVAEHPLREEFHGHLMTAYYRCGRQAEALRVFALLRASLVAELGVEPGPGLRELHLRILRGDAALLRADGGREAATGTSTGTGTSTSTSTSTSTDTATGELPVPTGAPARSRPLGTRLPPADPLFTGRTAELAELERLLRPESGSGAAVAVCGQAGAGKTALAIAAAHRLADAFPDGRVLLAAGSTPAGAAQAADLPERLAGQRVLVLLDDAVGAEQVRALLPVPPGCAVLVTSRRRLTGLPGLRSLTLGGFTPGESQQLLTGAGEPAGTARSTDPGEPAEPAELAELAELCGHLPLAVRIVADLLADRPHWSPDWLARQLRAESERLDWLRIGELDVRERLLTAHQLVGAAERRALGLLGLLPPGGFDLPVAVALLDSDRPAALRTLEELVGAGLLEAYRTPSGVAYRLPELPRLLAAEQVAAQLTPGELRSATERMCLAFASAAEAGAGSGAGLGTGSEAESGARRATLVRVARTAHEHGLWELTVRLAEALTPRLEREAAWTDWSQTHTLALDAAERCADLAAQARLLRSLGDLAWQRRQAARARECYQRAGTAARAVGDQEEYALALVGLAQLHLDEGTLAEAGELLEPALAALGGPAHGRGRYEANRALALLALARDAPAAAAGYFSECLELAGTLRDRRLEAYARRSLRALASGTDPPGIELRPGVWRLAPHSVIRADPRGRPVPVGHR